MYSVEWLVYKLKALLGVEKNFWRIGGIPVYLLKVFGVEKDFCRIDCIGLCEIYVVEKIVH